MILNIVNVVVLQWMGGKEYLRRSFMNSTDDYTELSEYEGKQETK